MNSRRLKKIMAFSLLAAAPIAAAIAQPDSPPITPDTGWVEACQKSVNNKIKGEHYDADKVTFKYDGMTLSKLSDTENKVTGAGEYIKSDGHWRTFNYECIFNGATNAVQSSSYFKASAYTEPEPQAVIAEATCDLFDKKSGRNHYQGGCTVSVMDEESGNEYQVALGDGEQYIFVNAGAIYNVKTPEGWSKYNAILTTDANRRIFYWDKWVLTIDGGLPTHGVY